MRSTEDIIAVSPVLAADVRHQLQAIRESGRLLEVIGGLGYHADSTVGRLLRQFSDRYYRRTEARRLSTEVQENAYFPTPWPELVSRAATTTKLRQPGPLATDAVFASIDRRAAKRIDAGIRLVLGREDGCLATFRAANRVGAASLYDLPIPHHRQLRAALELEQREFPDVAIGYNPHEEYDPRRSARKDAELAAASHVVVASEYVRGGLLAAGVTSDRISVIPYGCEPSASFRPFEERKPVVLYVGHLSIRKGIPRLLRVWKRLGGHRTHTLRLIGKKLLTEKFLGGYTGLYEYFPPMARSQLWEHFTAAQLFVFPSACDGFGLVLNEALSCGTPVIASGNTGAPGFITEGEHGLTYQHGDDDSLAAQLDTMLSNPISLRRMGRSAYELAQHWQWSSYRVAFKQLAASLVPQKLTK